MSAQVSITKGYYRGELVSGVFKLVQGFKMGARGGFVTIDNPNFKPGTGPVQRIKVDEGDFTVLGSDGQAVSSHALVTTTGPVVTISQNYEAEFISDETEDEAMTRIQESFLMLDQIVNAVCRGVIRGLVVSGPPGVGKSFGVEKQLDTVNLFRTVRGDDPRYEIVSGGVSSIGLYQKLYFNRAPDQVIVFDDCDGVLFDEESLNLLKAALNSGDRRRINWNKESRVLQTEDIPESFEFEGGIIFLSNIDFEKTIAKGSRISQHLAAIMSRCHYLDLAIGSTRDKLLRIKQIIRDGMLEPYQFDSAQQQLVVDFIFQNAEHLRELSLRTVKKVADFIKADPSDWHTLAEATVLDREAKFKRLVAKKREEASKRGAVLAETV